jgi:photosystem II stability/assembly factor-like uncharacterized protein
MTFQPDAPSYIGCIAMFNPRHGFGVGKTVDGKFQIFTTDDAGASWRLLPSDGMPAALPGERVYGRGGDCATATARTAFFASSYGGPDTIARVYRSSDDGLTWQVSDLPPELQEVTSIDFRTDRLGIASDGIGGSGFARTTDGGKTWVVDQSGLETLEVSWWGDRRGHERNPTPVQKTAFIGTTHGWTYFTRDRGKTWQSFDTPIGYFRIDCAERTLACWGAATSEGRIGRLVAD